jgi:hypothetical protein
VDGCAFRGWIIACVLFCKTLGTQAVTRCRAWATAQTPPDAEIRKRTAIVSDREGTKKSLGSKAQVRRALRPGKTAASDRITSTDSGNPPGNAVSIARLQMSAVFGARRVSRASTRNAADSALLFRKYCQKPPLLTSDSTSQSAENTFCGRDLGGKILLPDARLFGGGQIDQDMVLGRTHFEGPERV